MKIMIVEDDQTIREMVGEALHRWGFETVIVEDLDQVLQVFVREKPHLVIMDINLPSYDGFYWCNQIREVSKVPLIFLSSRNTPMDMVMSMNTGGDDFIQKPFHTDVLIANINDFCIANYDCKREESRQMDGVVALPTPQNHEQELYVKLIRKFGVIMRCR